MSQFFARHLCELHGGKNHRFRGATTLSLLLLGRRGVRPFPHPDVMLAYGSKDSLVKVASTDAGLEDTQAYLSVEDFRRQVTSARLGVLFGGH